MLSFWTSTYAFSHGLAIKSVAVTEFEFGEVRFFIASTIQPFLIVHSLSDFRIRTALDIKFADDPSRLRELLTLSEISVDPALLSSVLAELPISQVLPFIKRSTNNQILDVAYPISNSGQVVTTAPSIIPGQQKDKASTSEMSYPSGINPAAIDKAYASSAAIRENVQLVINYVGQAKTRLDCFYAELQREKELLDIAKSKTDSLDTEKTKNRVNQCIQTMNRLAERANTLLQIAMEIYSPALSEYERKWADEVNQMDKTVKEFKFKIEQASSSSSQMSRKTIDQKPNENRSP